jgi:hypothetical protein
MAKLLKTDSSSWKCNAQCAKSLWSGLQLNVGAESLMKLAGLLALKLSFYKSFIAENTSLNEPADAGDRI